MFQETAIRQLTLTLLPLFIFCCLLSAQQQQTVAPGAKWTGAASFYYNILPNEKNSFTLIGYTDHKKLHLETRYNYEDLHTVSVFTGWNFEKTGQFEITATPMLGGLLGNINGVAPGLELSLKYEKFDYYAESEYVIDFSGKESRFFYTWGELAFSPVRSLRTGISYQKTLLYQTGFDVQRGLFAEYSFYRLTSSGYFFNPFTKDNILIISIGIGF
ncbi:hypothetical protein [Paraflavitalea sp. CAU 1676]|uniref:hypothetical protein n=1 Tax=Paraflavitalea sp. CAU 1676 TaxID=3032598 RepID=UPI0023DC7929|nr:hypothetical protein [Paraflavitalea sp. CAU 1676]